jgi:hypothetical protein
MKIKNDFITNSSSTNFFFIFKGPRCVKSLVSAVWNHKKAFTLSYYLDETSNWSCKCQDIVEDIERCVKNSLGKDEWDSVKIVTLDKKISETDEMIKSEKAYHKDWLIDHPDDKTMDKITKEGIKYLEQRKRKLQHAKNKGFENALEMEWGDNHGHVSGGETGFAMDYAGKNIRINSDDLVVFTEQNR